jgi:glutathione S-transferase
VTQERVLFRFPYSCYAWKVQAVLVLRGDRVRFVDVPYGDRSELARLTGGYVHVPVLRLEDGTIVTDSRRICEALAAEGPGRALVPEALAGPVWAFADWCDAVLEDVAFRLASPGIRDRFVSPWEKALFVLIKERKWGPGAVDLWAAQRDDLAARARSLLAPVAHTLSDGPFVFGSAPSLADAALYGQLAMLCYANRGWPAWLPEPVARFAERMAACVGSVEVRHG